MRDIQAISNEYGPEIALTVLLLRIKMGKSPEEDVAAFLLNNKPDLNTFLNLLEAHQIESIVFSTRSLKNLFPWDSDIIKFKEKISLRSKVNLIILDELVALQRTFHQHHYEVLFYKGVILSKLLFGDFTTRTTSDIDILIKARDFASIRGILLGAGFEEMYFYSDRFPDYYLAVNRESLFRKKCIAGTYIYVEIQWAPLPEYYGLPFNNNYFFSSVVSERLLKEEINMPGLNEHMLILFIHHGISDLWRNLKHVFDIALLADKYQDTIDWKKIEQYIADQKFVRISIVGRNLCSGLFGVEIPIFSEKENAQKETDSCLHSLLSFPLLTKKKKTLVNLKRQLMLSDGFYERMKLCKGYLEAYIKPSMIDLKNQQFPPFLFPLYYITKRFRFLYGRK
jgi:Uncharacterised nucleotidyltransferase